MENAKLSKPIKIIIADDHLLYRTGIKITLSIKKDLEIIAEADDGMQLLNMLKTLKTDVILLDIQMPIINGIAALKEIKKSWPEIKIIMLTMINDDTTMTKLMELGANGYLSKTTDIEVIYEAIKTCYEQEYYYAQ